MLQRSVTDTRRLPSGRWSLSMIMDPNPGRATIPTKLLFPDRQTLLYRFDHVAARRECGFAMRRSGRDCDARLTHGNQTEAVLQHHARVRPPPLRFGQHLLDLGERHVIVSRILDPGDVIVAAHGAQKHTRAPTLRALYCTEQRFNRDRGASEVRHHPPESGGSSAMSSPSLTRASSFTCR